jgi:hypothetical protein
VIPPWIRDLDDNDPYALLGIDRTATSAQVSQAYLKLIKVVHPDLPTGDEEKAKLIGLARGILLDASKRADYNRYTDTGSVVDPSAASAWDGADIADGLIDSPVWTVREPSYDEASPPKPPGRYGLGLGALVASFVCGPAGLVMAIIALSGQRSRHDRTCAWVAIGVGAVQVVLCCVGVYGLSTAIDPAYS